MLFFFQAEDGIRDLVRSRGLGDVYKRQLQKLPFSFYDEAKTGQIMSRITNDLFDITEFAHHCPEEFFIAFIKICLLYTSDAADERSSVDLGGRRSIKTKTRKKKKKKIAMENLNKDTSKQPQTH